MLLGTEVYYVLMHSYRTPASGNNKMVNDEERIKIELRWTLAKHLLYIIIYDRRFNCARFILIYCLHLSMKVFLEVVRQIIMFKKWVINN